MEAHWNFEDGPFGSGHLHIGPVVAAYMIGGETRHFDNNEALNGIKYISVYTLNDDKRVPRPDELIGQVSSDLIYIDLMISLNEKEQMFYIKIEGPTIRSIDAFIAFEKNGMQKISYQIDSIMGAAKKLEYKQKRVIDGYSLK
jgi:hypothetical protein